VGYAGGTTPNPTYHRMGDHSESLQFEFDPSRKHYAELLELFFEAHQPTRLPSSMQYASAVFTQGEAQHREALAAKARWEQKLGRKIYTRVEPLKAFFRAEDYHQKYYLRAVDELVDTFHGYDELRFQDSTVAARLNGYVIGDGSSEQLAREVDRFGLTSSAKQLLEERVARMSQSSS
jgi:methionine-S-sulfoxide reductase